MMKNGHAWSGMTAGLAVALLTKAPPVLGIISAGIVGGAALGPDIDQPSATISRVFGPLSQWFSEGVNAVSARVYDATASEYDEDRDGGHRGFTHTVVFAVAVSALCSFVAQWWQGLAAVLFLCVSLALRGLLGNWAKRRGWLSTTAVAGALTTVLVFALPAGYGTGQLGLLVGLGCIVHCWGDSLTISGCPWLWPVPIRGERWYPIGTPGFLRFHAGGRIEKRYVLRGWIAAAGALTFTYIPGGWTAVGDVSTWAVGLVGL